MTQEINQLAILLEDAADEKPGAAEAFYELLLNSEVFIPTHSTKEKIFEVGSSHADQLGFMTINYEGQECLPIFSQESFIYEWAGKEVSFTKKSFSSLLWLVGDMWLYLDSNQLAGKEITAWEIELLKKGKDTIPELVAASSENPLLELEVETNSDLFAELKRQVIPVLELSSKLEAAFMVGIKDDGNTKPMLGLKYGKVTDAERKYIRDELLQVSEQLLIVDDIGVGASDSFFNDATPFFIAQKEIKNAENSIFSEIKKLFTKK